MLGYPRDHLDRSSALMSVLGDPLRLSVFTGRPASPAAKLNAIATHHGASKNAVIWRLRTLAKLGAVSKGTYQRWRVTPDPYRLLANYFAVLSTMASVHSAR